MLLERLGLYGKFKRLSLILSKEVVYCGHVRCAVMNYTRVHCKPMSRSLEASGGKKIIIPKHNNCYILQ
jgi:hypothetical protein